MTDDKHAGNVLLLRTASICILIGLVLAWCLTLNNMKVPFVVETFKKKEALLSAHLDFLMMAMLLLGFYASKIPLPKFVQWPMAIGSITNPTLFLIGSVAPGMKSPFMMTPHHDVHFTDDLRICHGIDQGVPIHARQRPTPSTAFAAACG